MNDPKKYLIELLQEMIDAGQGRTLPLEMNQWHCGTSCCLCGDVAAKRCGGDNFNMASPARRFSEELDERCESIFSTCDLVESAYNYSAYSRLREAVATDLFTEDELKHPHLTTDHSDRAIAHDYIRLVIKKIEEY